ncbi:MAG: hypothetical protein ACJAT8_000721, partial [Cellvibrionaceae bacterium]
SKQDKRSDKSTLRSVGRNEPIEHKSSQLKRELSQQRQPAAQVKSFERKGEPMKSNYSRQRDVAQTKYETKPVANITSKPRTQELQQAQRNTRVETSRLPQVNAMRNPQQQVKQIRRSEPQKQQVRETTRSTPQQASRSMSQQRDNASSRRASQSRDTGPSREKQSRERQ